MGASSFVEEIKSDIPCKVSEEWNIKMENARDYDSDDSYDSAYPNSIAGVGPVKFFESIEIFRKKNDAEEYILNNTDKWSNGIAVRVSIDGKIPRKPSLEKRKKEIEKIEEIKLEMDKIYKTAVDNYKQEIKTKYEENKKLEKPKLILIKCDNCRSQINLDYYKNQFHFSTQTIKCFVCKNQFMESKNAKEYNKIKVKYEKLVDKIKDKPLYHYLCGGWSPC